MYLCYLNALRFSVRSRHGMLSQWIYGYCRAIVPKTYWLTKKAHIQTHKHPKNDLLYGCIEYISWPPWMGFTSNAHSNPIDFLSCFFRQQENNNNSNTLIAKSSDIFLLYCRTELFIWKNCRCNINVLSSSERGKAKRFHHCCCYHRHVMWPFFHGTCPWCWCAPKWRWHRFE